MVGSDVSETRHADGGAFLWVVELHPVGSLKVKSTWRCRGHDFLRGLVLKERMDDRLDPSELASKRGRDRSVAPDGDFVAEHAVPSPPEGRRNQEGEEVQCREELVVPSEPRVELRALVMDHAVRAVGESPERDGCALHVGEEALQTFAVPGLNLPLPANGKARVRPAFHNLHRLGSDLPSAEHHPEEALAEDLLEPGEVEVLHGGGTPHRG